MEWEMKTDNKFNQIWRIRKDAFRQAGFNLKKIGNDWYLTNPSKKLNRTDQTYHFILKTMY